MQTESMTDVWEYHREREKKHILLGNMNIVLNNAKLCLNLQTQKKVYFCFILFS